MTSQNRKASPTTSCRGSTPLLTALVAATLAAHAAWAQAPAPEERAGIPAESGSADAVDVTALRSARDALVDAADFAGARVPAEQVVTALEDTADGPEITDIMRLARIQSELHEFDDAEDSYLRVIERLEDAEGELAPVLVTPYQALGRTYINARRFEDAVAALGRARDISRRDAGLFNVEQSELIDDISLAMVGLGDTAGAYALQKERLENAVRLYGADDPRVAPYHAHLGDYLDSSRLRTSARAEYSRALELQEAEYGAESPELLPGLRRLVEVDLLLNRGPDARDRLAAVLERNPDARALERGLALATLGDWSIAHEDTVAAADYYAQAYSALAAEPRIDRDAVFAKPKMLDFVPPLSPVDQATRKREYAWGSIKVGFDVASDGRARDIEVMEIVPPDTLEEKYVRRVGETHFRPKLVAGVPTMSENVEYTHYFRLYLAKRR